MHEVCPYKTCEGERALDGCLCLLGKAEQQVSDEGDGDLAGRGVEIIGQDTQHLAGLDLDRDLANGLGKRVPAVSPLTFGQ